MWVLIVFLKLLVWEVLIDEIIFENFKKVNKTNHEGVKIWTTYLDHKWKKNQD
jgi:hypothetical protein